MKIFNKLFLTIAIIVALSTTSFAYIDPSVMTYVIQAIAGVVIAIGAAVSIYWRKAKKKVNNVLKIDEDRKKSVEDDVVIICNDSEK